MLFQQAKALEIWGEPKSLADISVLFAQFCRGQLLSLPWSDQAPAKETSVISEELAKINEAGYLTINSQPPVDGVSSDHPIHGWGPRNGYVYQKAYLEFFCSPEHYEALISVIENDPNITYHAVTKSCETLKTNATPGPNAVTWGAFPAKEIIQPTIVEGTSFMAWKVS